MALILSFANQKGGQGKSALTAMTANALSQEPFNYKVSVIDTDPQQSLVNYRNMFDASEEQTYKIESGNNDNIFPLLKRLDNNDIVLIDAAGKLDYSQSLAYLDFLFVPVRSGSFNIESTIEFLKVAKKIQKSRPSNKPLNIFVLVNMYRPRLKMSKILIDDLNEICKELDMPLMRTRLRNFTLFEDVDTINTFYNENSSDPAKLNFTIFLNELIRKISD